MHLVLSGKIWSVAIKSFCLIELASAIAKGDDKTLEHKGLHTLSCITLYLRNWENLFSNICLALTNPELFV